MNIIERLIIKKCPNYDFNRYRFKSGDYVTTLCGAKIIVKESALEYVDAYVLNRSLKYREKGLQRVYYDDLPYFEESAFINKLPKIQSRVNWKLYDIVHLELGNMTVLLTEEKGHQQFYAYVLSSDNNYYLHTSIYIENPYKDYIASQ